MQSAVFLDRDGVINEDRSDYVKSWSEVVFLECAMPALRRLASLPLAVVIVSNQAGVGRGLLDHETAWDIQRKIVRHIELCGGRINASYLCPHHPDDRCACRKPRPGMLQQAADDLKIDLASSWLVGDALTDLQTARAAGVRGILVRTGRGREQEPSVVAEQEPSWRVVDDLAGAVDCIEAFKEVRA